MGRQGHSGNFFVSYLGDYGTYKNGFWNSVFAKKDVQSMTTDSSLPVVDETTGKTHENPKTYDVIYIDGVCYYYTGWTSVGKEGASNGVMMMDSRTGDITYYPTYGISEGKAQSVVEGLVSDKGYESTYPLLLKVAGEETYFHLMRDKSDNLVGYAFCSYKDYQKAAYGKSIDEAEAGFGITGVILCSISLVISVILFGLFILALYSGEISIFGH